jgi:hypothetical protein
MQAVLRYGCAGADISGMAGMQVGDTPPLTVLQYNQGDVQKESGFDLVGTQMNCFSRIVDCRA